jgi:hypothetical protein
MVVMPGSMGNPVIEVMNIFVNILVFLPVTPMMVRFAVLGNSVVFGFVIVMTMILSSARPGWAGKYENT